MNQRAQSGFWLRLAALMARAGGGLALANPPPPPRPS